MLEDETFKTPAFVIIYDSFSFLPFHCHPKQIGKRVLLMSFTTCSGRVNTLDT